MKESSESIEFWGVGDQLSRKVIAPDLGRIVEAFNEYYYSSELNLHVRREFLQATPEVKQAAADLEIDLYSDKEGRVINITYHEAKDLLDRRAAPGCAGRTSRPACRAPCTWVH